VKKLLTQSNELDPIDLSTVTNRLTQTVFRQGPGLLLNFCLLSPLVANCNASPLLALMAVDLNPLSGTGWNSIIPGENSNLSIVAII